MKKSRPLKSWFLCLMVGAGALAVYFVTVSRTFYPVESANYLAVHLGHWPFPALSYPLWGACMKLLNLLPGGAILFNAFSAVCAALAVMLLFLLTFRMTYLGLPERYRDPPAIGRGRVISALTASAVLAFSVPFWFSATRAHPAAFDLFLLLGVIWLLVRFHEAPSRLRLLIFALVWGLAITENATVILLSVAFAPALAAILWREKMLNFKIIGPALVCFLLGLTVYVFQTLSYVRHPAFDWQELEGFFQVLWFIWREQYLDLKAGMGANGWIVILISMLVPLLSLFPNTLSGSRTIKFQWTHFLLYFAFTVLWVVVLFNITPAPWPMVKLRPLLIFPYVACSMWMGYLAGLFYAVIRARQKENSRFVTVCKKTGGPLFTALLTAALAAAAVLNFAVIDTRPGDRVADMAANMVRALDTQKWLITDGLLDANLRLSSSEQGIPVNLLNIRMSGKKGYLNYLASMFISPRLQGLARIGVVPLLKEWLQYDDASIEQVAIATDAEIWRYMGKDSWPDRGVFKGTLKASAIHADDYFASQQAFWEKAKHDFATDVDEDNIASAYWYWARSHLSKTVNNSGVLLHDLNRPDLAAQAYREARQIDTNNLCAMLNLHALAATEKMPEYDALNQELEAFIANLEGKLRMDRLTARYGLIRDPRLFVQRGLLLAASGQASAALHEIEKVSEKLPVNTGLQLVLAGMYSADQQVDRSVVEYQDILEREPQNPYALAAMVKIGLQQNNPDLAEKYLNVLSTVTNVNLQALQYQRALLDVVRDRKDAAILKLKDIIRLNPEHSQATLTLMMLAQVSGDVQAVEETMAILTARLKTEPRLALGIAVIELQRHNYKSARRYLENYTRTSPSDLNALDMLLRLDTVERKRNKVEEHVEQMLSINPRHALANYVLGTLQMSRGELSLAEESYRTSLASQETPEVLNDLAWLLHERGADEEALDFSYRSLAMNDRSAAGWDTYAMILLGLNKLMEAEEAISMAINLLPADPVFQYHLALIQEKQGNLKDARQTVQPLLDRAAEIPPDTFGEIRKMISRLPQ